jgi:dethiobiotin synthetase
MVDMRPTLFITGTDTGVGKTVFTRLLAQFLHRRGINVAALKPVCSGGRADARALHAALGGALTLDEINPWHFRAPVAPSLAARLEKKSVKLALVVAHIRAWQKKSEITLVEGAGGLLSPLGEDFDSRDLIAALRATSILVTPNKLGAVNHVLLTLKALPKNLRSRAKIVLVSSQKPDAAAASNARLLARFSPPAKIFTLPWLGGKCDVTIALETARVRKMLVALVEI